MLVETAEGRASGSSRLDLGAFKLDSQWRLEARMPERTPESGAAAAARPLPPVIVSYRGPVAALRGVEQQIDATAVEQELSARKIERDLEELERLRRLNEADQLRKSVEPSPLPPQPALPVSPPALPGAPLPPAGAPG
jgi:hypothetical protein